MKKLVLAIGVILMLLVFTECKQQSVEDFSIGSDSKDYYKELHRPQFHFSPETGWMNDPNGMVFYDDEYHLFYQYYPDSTVWGPMHWGHAVSNDLISWEHLPIALYPDEHGLIFSGSAVVDWKNTTGFGMDGKPPLVAIYSYHDMDKERAGVEDDFQTQGIAYSNDKGRTWTKYSGNPVIENPGIRDFRDPKVFWYEPTQKWIMAVSALDHLMFYGSSDLKKWDLLSEFGMEIGSHGGVWECPDLFPMVADNGKEYWVLIENMNPGNPNGGSGTQYFIGQFDGEKFEVDPNFMKLLETKPAFSPKGKVFEGFESGYDKWEVEGEAFGVQPIAGSVAVKDRKITGYRGASLATSFMKGNGLLGKLISKPFKVESNAINFLIGGGNHRGRTFIGLEVAGNIVRLTEGRNKNVMEWNGWDVSAYKGAEAKIVIVDDYAKDFGYLSVDEITFAAEVATYEQTGSVWLDAGTDNYAGVTWSDVPESDGRRVFMGWMSNWAYAQVVPTEKWRSAMTIPWTLSVEHVAGIPRLVGQPVKELAALAAGEWKALDLDNGIGTLPVSGLYEIMMEGDASGDLGFELSNDKNEKISLLLKENVFSLDRTKTGDNSFSKDFAGIHTATRISTDSSVKIHTFVDHSSMEIFLDDGKNVFSELFFPSELYKHIRVLGDGATVKIRPLKSVWGR